MGKIKSHHIEIILFPIRIQSPRSFEYRVDLDPLPSKRREIRRLVRLLEEGTQ